MSNYIFVYGTLKRGGRSNSLLSDCEFIGVGRAWGCVLLNLGEIPGLIPANIKNSDRCNSVLGEVYAVPDKNWHALLRQLDRLERAWRMYLRVKIEIDVGGSTKECTTYLYMPTIDSENVVSEGVWKVPVV